MALHKPPTGIKVQDDRELIQKEHNVLLTRIVGSIFVVAAIMSGIYFGGVVWSIVAGFAALGSLLEFYRLLSARFRISKAWGLLATISVITTVSLGYNYALTMSIISITAFLVLFTEVVRRQNTGHSFALWNLGGTLAGIIYIALPWSFMISIRAQTWGHIFLMTIFACTWACDVFAYLVGSKLGSSPFCSAVSPKKTWEGFWAGAVASMLCGMGSAFAFEFPPVPLVLLGLLCGVAGQLGDLGESVLKREANVKDTGSLIPGHGGLLDRFDSILVNATLAFFIFEVLG